MSSSTFFLGVTLTQFIQLQAYACPIITNAIMIPDATLLVDSQGDVSRELNLAFLLVDSFNFNFADEEC